MKTCNSQLTVPAGWDRQWDWTEALANELGASDFHGLMDFVNRERDAYEVFPPESQVFEAFRRTPLACVRVVLLGQDPYHNPGQAHGLSFSVPAGMEIPPSLSNILRERQSDLGLEPLANGDLGHWAEQGVLLLNSVLTVRSGAAFSHRDRGWEPFTDAVIRCISDCRPYVVFLLWGAAAQRKSAFIDARHERLHSPHPSPLSAYRGFIGSRVFSRCNRALAERGFSPIAW